MSPSSFRPSCAWLLSAALASTLAACAPPAPKPPPTEDPRSASRLAVLKAAGECALSTGREFQTDATALEAAIAAHQASRDPQSLETARAAFKEAMTTWEIAEVMQFGPAAPRLVPGGGDLRDQIYSWPLVSRCAVEEQLVAKGYEAADFGSTLITRRGLDAIEYLLFYEGTDTACGGSSAIVSGGTWAALSADELALRKRDYAKAAAAQLVSRAAELVNAWDPAGGNFLATLSTPGAENPHWPTTHAALNAVSNALFYVELEVKDMKLAKPLGLRECDTGTCPELLESRFAGLSKESIRANLIGYRRLTEGCGEDFSGTGFDDLLEASGAGELAGRIRTANAAAIASVEAIEEADLAEALSRDLKSVRALYDGVKSSTDLLKTEVVTVLDLELPQTVEGDND